MIFKKTAYFERQLLSVWLQRRETCCRSKIMQGWVFLSESFGLLKIERWAFSPASRAVLIYFFFRNVHLATFYTAVQNTVGNVVASSFHCQSCVWLIFYQLQATRLGDGEHF